VTKSNPVNATHAWIIDLGTVLLIRVISMHASSGIPHHGVKPDSNLISRAGITNRLKRLATFVFAQDCALCRAPSGAAFVCAPCERDLPRLATSCPVCAMPSPHGERCGACLREPPAYRATVAAFPYAYPIDRVLQGLKYHARLPAAAWFALRLIDAIDTQATIDPLVIPIPLSTQRLRERGFNQAWEIARRVALGVSYDAAPMALARVRDTRAQAILPLAERHRNMRGAFQANAEVIGRHVAIVDDVMTSGATLDAAAQAALSGGALSVTCWVAARAYAQVG
jgi:ComF family protein